MPCFYSKEFAGMNRALKPLLSKGSDNGTPASIVLTSYQKNNNERIKDETFCH
jgi:hypothetical protein